MCKETKNNFIHDLSVTRVPRRILKDVSRLIFWFSNSFMIMFERPVFFKIKLCSVCPLNEKFQQFSYKCVVSDSQCFV